MHIPHSLARAPHVSPAARPPAPRRAPLSPGIKQRRTPPRAPAPAPPRSAARPRTGTPTAGWRPQRHEHAPTRDTRTAGTARTHLTSPELHRTPSYAAPRGRASARACSADATVSHTESSAKKRPGQILAGGTGVSGAARRRGCAYLLPKPNAARDGSGSPAAPSAPGANLSGLKACGSLYTAGSCRIALG